MKKSLLIVFSIISASLEVLFRLDCAGRNMADKIIGLM